MTTQITYADSEALAAEHHLPIEEWEPEGLSDSFRNKVMAFYAETADERVIVVFPGQDPAERLHAVRQLLDYLEATAC